MSALEIYVIVAIVCAFVGLIIGANKGLALGGFLLGGMLGVLGLIILIVMKPGPSHQQPQPLTPAGWYRDPWGAHQTRYWDGAAWTPNVADNGVSALDPR